MNNYNVTINYLSKQFIGDKNLYDVQEKLKNGEHVIKLYFKDVSQYEDEHGINYLPEIVGDKVGKFHSDFHLMITDDDTVTVYFK